MSKTWKKGILPFAIDILHDMVNVDDCHAEVESGLSFLSTFLNKVAIRSPDSLFHSSFLSLSTFFSFFFSFFKRFCAVLYCSVFSRWYSLQQWDVFMFFFQGT